MSANSHTRASQKRSFATKSYERHLRASSASSETSLDLEDSVGSFNGLTTTGTHEQRISNDVEIAQAQNDHVAALFQRVRQTCLSKSNHGIQDLGIMFRHLDIDYNKRITFQELKDKLKEYGMSCSDIDLNILFCHLDKDGSGGIDFVELMEALRPPMKQCRIDVINEAFDIVDSGENGTIDMDEIRVVYAANARRHPKFISGEWTEEQTLRHFLDSLDTPGSPDGKVTRQEFMNYYAGVSVTVDDDCYFDMMMRSVYGLPAVSSRTKNAAKTGK